MMQISTAFPGRSIIKPKNFLLVSFAIYIVGAVWIMKNAISFPKPRESGNNNNNRRHGCSAIELSSSSSSPLSNLRRKQVEEDHWNRLGSNIDGDNEEEEEEEDTLRIVPPGVVEDSNNDGGESEESSMIHVLILISSVKRKPETVCTTIRYALENFRGEAGSVESSSYLTTTVKPPHILLHRYGDFPCNDDNITNSATTFTTNSLTIEQYPAHEHANSQQQTIDYLHLMDRALRFIQEWQQKQQQQQQQHPPTSSFTHVMFLDDDVELCPRFSTILAKAREAFPSSFGMGHFGRGGSGMYIPVEALPKLKSKMLSDKEQGYNTNKRGQQNSKNNKNVDTSMIEWGLQHPMICLLRPVTIRMRHIGFSSSMKIQNRQKRWRDSDRCGGPTDNVNWRALSESADADFFGEHCINPVCSPYGSTTSSKGDDATATAAAAAATADGGSNYSCSCKEGYTGQDCGLPISDEAYFVRRKYVAPIVALLDSTVQEKDTAIADSERHRLINLYVLGNQPKTAWLSSNVYATTKNALTAFRQDLKDSPRFGELAFPIELVLLHEIVPPENLWSLKYYERRN